MKKIIPVNELRNDEDYRDGSFKSKWILNSGKTETLIIYNLPGVKVSELEVFIDIEDGDNILFVKTSQRDFEGFKHIKEYTKFHFFPREIPEKVFCELGNWVLTIHIPKSR